MDKVPVEDAGAFGSGRKQPYHKHYLDLIVEWEPAQSYKVMLQHGKGKSRLKTVEYTSFNYENPKKPLGQPNYSLEILVQQYS